MAGLASIVGQPLARAALGRAFSAGRVHHAYLFDGPEGVGKATTARALAMALNCEREPGSGCGACTPCEKIAAGLHPDVIFPDMTFKGLTERMRELITLAGFRPHEGRARVVILDPADALAGAQVGRTEAANVLLKTLEEPPADSYFVLCTAEPRRLPVTVRSRCQRVRFVPLGEADVARILVGRGVAPAEAERVAAEADGSAGRALGLVEAGDDAVGPRAEALAEKLLEAVVAGRARALFDAAGEAGGDREVTLFALGRLWLRLHDRLLAGEGLDEGLPPGRRAAAERALPGWSGGELLAALRLVDDAREAARGNVAPSLVLEHLLFGLGARQRAAQPQAQDGAVRR